MSNSTSLIARRAIVAVALSASAFVLPAPAAAAGINNCTATRESTTPYVDSCPSGRVNFFQRFALGDGAFNDNYLYNPAIYDSPTGDFRTWWSAHDDRAIAYDPSKTSTYRQGLRYFASFSIPKDGTGQPVASDAQYVLRSALDRSKLLYLDYDCGNNTCAAYAGDMANPNFRAKRIADIFTEYDKGYFKGLWLDDVPIGTLTTDGSGPYNYGLATRTQAYSPYLGRNLTDDDWRRETKKFLSEMRAYKPLPTTRPDLIPFARPTEILVNVKWDPNVLGGGMANTDAQALVAEADYVDLEGGSADPNLQGGTGTYSMSNLRDYVKRIHNVGTAVVWDDFVQADYAQANPAAARVLNEYSVANHLLMNAGNDAVGLGSQSPATWWAGYDINLGAAQTHLPYSWNGLLRRDFAKGIVLSNDPTAPGATPANTPLFTLPRPLVDTNGNLVTQISLAPRSAAVLRDPASAGTKPGATRADFLAVSGTSARIGQNTARGVAGPLTRALSVAGSRGTFTGDIAGDGADEVLKLDTNGNATVYRVTVGATMSTTPLATSQTALPAATYGTYFNDVTGDGRADLVAWNDGSASVAIGVGASNVGIGKANGFFAPRTFALPTGFFGTKANQVADMNGDKRGDLVAWNTDGSVRVALSNGYGFSAPTTWVTQSDFVGTLANLACDVTGDGKADLVAVSSTIKASITSAAGTAGALPATNPGAWTPGAPGATYRCADIDADGDRDIVSWNTLRILATPSSPAGTGGVQFSGTRSIGPIDSYIGAASNLNLMGEFDRQ